MHRPERSDGPNPARVPVIVAIALLLVVGLVVDRADRRSVRAVRASGPPLSSTWYCAGATAAPDGRADGIVYVANPDDTTLTGEVTVVGQDVEPASRPIEVPPLSRVAVRYADVLTSASAASIVELRGGIGIVEEFVDGPLGHSAAPCVTSASPEWHVADGSTARDATMTLALFNPFPEDAIADLSFATDQGRAVPADFQGIVVPALRVVAVDVGAHVRRRELVAATVSARSGRLVVTKLQARTAGGRAGLSVSPAVPEPQLSWSFPEGFLADGLREQLHLYNPSGDEARADVELALEDGDVEPFELTIPPHGRITLDLGAEERVPKGVPFGLIVSSSNDVPLVVERAIEAGAPSARTGRTASIGTDKPARRWGFAIGGASPVFDEWIAVLNPSSEPVTFSVIALADGQLLGIEGLQDVELAGGRRTAVRLGDHIQREALPLVVEASAPIVVERDLYQVGKPGMSAATGQPLD